MTAPLELIYTGRDGQEHRGSFWSAGPADMPSTRFLRTLDGPPRFVLVKTPTPKEQAAGVKPYEVIQGSKAGPPPKKRTKRTSRSRQR